MDIVKCYKCHNPVFTEQKTCPECGSPVVPQLSAALPVTKGKNPPNVQKLAVTLAAWCALIIVLNGFKFGPGTVLLLTGVCTIYGIRILKTVLDA